MESNFHFGTKGRVKKGPLLYHGIYNFKFLSRHLVVIKTTTMRVLTNFSQLNNMKKPSSWLHETETVATHRTSQDENIYVLLSAKNIEASCRATNAIQQPKIYDYFFFIRNKEDDEQEQRDKSKPNNENTSSS